MRTMVPVRIALVACVAMIAPSSMAQDKGKSEATELSSESQAALKQLYAGVPFAKALGPKAHAVLVFPEITKAGLVVGGQYGEGALLQKDQAVGYYKTMPAETALTDSCWVGRCPCLGQRGGHPSSAPARHP